MDNLVNNSLRATVHVAVGIVANAEGELLVAKRPEHWLGGGFWEFPGGKLEANESSEAALKRELFEEIGIVVHRCSPLIRLTYEYPERTIVLHAWNVLSFSGQAIGLEGQEISWCNPSALNALNMLPANRAIMVATQLPDYYLITPECSNKVIFLKELEQALSNNIKLVQLCSKSLTPQDYLSLAKSALEICHGLGAKLILDTDNAALLDTIDADGIHLGNKSLRVQKKSSLPAGKWVSGSCHNEADIKKAEELGLDFIVVKPVNDLSGQRYLFDWQVFTTLVALANIPVYALGSMTKRDLTLAKKRGAQGISGTSAFWDF